MLLLACFVFLQVFQRCQNPVGAGIDPDRRHVTPSDDTLAINHEQCALRNAVLGAIDAVFLRHRALWFEVRKQLEMEITILLERLMAPRSVDGYAKNLSVLL